MVSLKMVEWNQEYCFIETEKFSDFLREGSKLFHSIMVNGKKRAFEKVVFCVWKGNVK